VVENGIRGELSSEAIQKLQSYTTKERLFPNLRAVRLWNVTRRFTPFIPLFLSPNTTTINIEFAYRDLPNSATAARAISTFVSLCPNLQNISFRLLPRGPTIDVAVSGILLARRDTLQCFHTDSPLIEEARRVVCQLPDLRELSVFINNDTPFPTLVLPSLTKLTIKIESDHDSDWSLMLRGAVFGKLEYLTLDLGSEHTGDSLEEFKSVALAASVQNTLLEFRLYTLRSWNPNYSSLLPFTQLIRLIIESSCNTGCSSNVDDDVITNLARTMPKLETLLL